MDSSAFLEHPLFVDLSLHSCLYAQPCSLKIPKGQSSARQGPNKHVDMLFLKPVFQRKTNALESTSPIGQDFARHSGRIKAPHAALELLAGTLLSSTGFCFGLALCSWL